MAKIGYARVSTEDQNLDLQRDALKAAGCKKIFEEKVSGRAGSKRPVFDATLAYLRDDDQLVVWKMDRLGRSLREMINTAHDLQQRAVEVMSLTEQFDTKTANGRLMFNFLGTMAEYFLDLNRERTMAGLKAAIARGRKGGRKRKLGASDLAAAKAMIADGTISIADIAKRVGVSTRTFYSYFPAPRSNGRQP